MKSFAEYLTDYLDGASNSNIKKGKALYQKFWRESWNPTNNNGLFCLNVHSESFHGSYEVTIDVIDEYPSIFCECPAWEHQDECKHCLAAVFWCLDNPDSLPVLRRAHKRQLPSKSAGKMVPAKPGAMLYTEVEMRGNLSSWTFDSLATKRNGNLFDPRTILVSELAPSLQFKFKKSAKEFFDISIEYNLKDSFRTGCSCGHNNRPQHFCEHIHAAFQYVSYHIGDTFFLSYKDFTDEKKAILQNFGFSTDDPEAAAFKWGINFSGDLILSEKPSFIISKGDTGFFDQFNKTIRSAVLSSKSSLRPLLPRSKQIDFEVGLLFNFASTRHIGFELEPIEIRDKKGMVHYKKLNANHEANWALLKPLDDELYELTTNLSDKCLIDWMAGQGRKFFSYQSANPWIRAGSEDIKFLRKRYYEQLKKHWVAIAKWPNVYLLLDKKFSNKSIKPVVLSEKFVRLSFNVTTDDRFITVHLAPQVEGGNGTGRETLLLRLLIYLVDDTLYLPAKAEDLVVMQLFENGFLKFSKDDRRAVFTTVIASLMERYEVSLPADFNIRHVSTNPLPQLNLGELNEQSLMLYPKFLYDTTLLDASPSKTEITEDETGFKMIERKPDQEKVFFDFVRQLHPKFAQQRNNPYFYLPFAEVMRGNWFLKAIQAVQDAGYGVYGLQELKHFRYNTNKPIWQMKAGSGNDWFDLSIEIVWGNLSVPLKDIRKAIATQQTTVLLDDGTLGLLPEEWIKQYGLILKMGEEKNGSLRINKRQFGLLDDLAAQLNNHEVVNEIKARKEKLTLLDKHQATALSHEIKANLRPYQLSGFNWLQTLDELGWGGCLADDMGLGKTLQTISFLQFLKEKYAGSTHLVICPTSLIYNWKNEIDKFCPTLKYHIYYGQLRELGDEHFELYDVVISSYGVVRNDIETMAKFSWHYVILDESQSIKNPDAITTRAVSLLPSKNKLALSGTPVQNNTYDLYAQFNFINPGLLGTRDFFRNEFANPIDKQGDKVKTHQLRKIIYPFLLRRTKDQVAPDLPDKTEIILWCEMGREQRSIYESYRKYYRDVILKKIDDVGMNKAGMYVLEGLLRLRQICDHPKLVKDQETNIEESVKTEELVREVEEGTGQHKILIFSQFVEMLQIIKMELAKKDIKYSYLDGATSTTDRQKEVERFQRDESVKVFLISLKAGGVGLNLTAADYVYIVDPWWNPAAEQQAIDRTHRIGQTRKIFAYKMICKDSVEEKILKLQEKKKSLTDELVSEDAGFVKKLTRDDIAFLLS